MNRWNLIIDVTKCNNCNNCVMSAKDEYIGNDFPGYSAPQPKAGHDWIGIDRHVRGSGSMIDVTYVPRMCNHCDDAPCVRAGDGAVVKRDDGIVLIDPVKARGRRDLVDACPHGAVWWNEELQIPQAWTFDAHLLDAGADAPRCVTSCATGAMSSLKITDAEMAGIVAREGLQGMLPETRPRVHYKGLEITRTAFLGGNVCARSADGLLENVEDATVRLDLHDGAPARSLHTDVWGDFKFDGLDQPPQSYTLTIHHPRHGTAEVSGNCETSQSIGSIELAAA